jgi:hypothetical protein
VPPAGYGCNGRPALNAEALAARPASLVNSRRHFREPSPRLARHVVAVGSWLQMRMLCNRVRRDDGAVMVTSRVARQTNRWVRFAKVTVQVVPAVANEVTIAPGVLRDQASRLEAACGAREALGHVPADRGFHRVDVVDAVTTEVDTGVGDVYEVTARAVREALSLDPSLLTGFSDPQIVAGWLRERIGAKLAGVTEARYWISGKRDPDAASLVHAWLHFEHRPPTQLHGCGDDLQLSIADPYPGYDMDRFGEVRVASAAVPDSLAMG